MSIMCTRTEVGHRPRAPCGFRDPSVPSSPHPERGSHPKMWTNDSPEQAIIASTCLGSGSPHTNFQILQYFDHLPTAIKVPTTKVHSCINKNAKIQISIHFTLISTKSVPSVAPVEIEGPGANEWGGQNRHQSRGGWEGATGRLIMDLGKRIFTLWEIAWEGGCCNFQATLGSGVVLAYPRYR